MRWTWQALAFVLGVWPAFGQDPPGAVKDWFNIPSGEAAIAIYFEWEVNLPTLTVSDAAANRLDAVYWEIGLPLVRQYRVEPGEYEIHVNGFIFPGKVSLASGELTYLRLQAGPQADRPYVGLLSGSSSIPIVSDVSAVLTGMAYKVGVEAIAPVHLAPAGKALYFNTEPPFEIPKPPTEPKPQ